MKIAAQTRTCPDYSAASVPMLLKRTGRPGSPRLMAACSHRAILAILLWAYPCREAILRQRGIDAAGATVLGLIQQIPGQARNPGDLPPHQAINDQQHIAADLLGGKLLIGAFRGGQQLPQAL